MPELAIVADDLSGASEAAAAFLLRTTRIAVHLYTPAHGTGVASSERVLAIDTDSRRSSPVDAAARVQAALASLSGVPVLKKVDSLLRGNLSSEVEALRGLLGAAPIVATALPVADRVVVDGVLRVGGVPLHQTRLWHAERNPAPRTVAEALAPLDTWAVPLATVRRGVDALAQSLAAAAAAGLVAVCDSESDSDLDAVYAASHRVSERPLLVGSAALAAAAARALEPDDQQPAAGMPVAEAVLVVAGSAAPSLPVQLPALESSADAVLRLDPHALLRDPDAARREVAARVRGARCAVVSLDGSAGVRADLAPRLAAALAQAVASPAADGRALVLTGGETAREVLDLLGIDRLLPVAERWGAVISRAGGRLVVTRPGSFGGPTSLADLVTSLLTEPVPEEPT